MPARNENYFSVEPYVTPLYFGAARGIVTAIRLIGAAPPELQARPRDALEVVREKCIALQELLRERMRVAKVDLGDLDSTLDSAWVGFRMALEALARLVRRPVAKEAADLLKLVLPDETDFVLSAYELQWNESNTLLDRIDVQGLAPRIEALVGGEFLPAIRDAHQAFGDALGLGDTPFTPEEGVSISAAIDALALAIAEYGRLMSGQLDRNDPASVDAFKAAMAPIDAYRQWLSSRHEEAEPTKPQPSPENPIVVEGDVQPTDPVPPVPGT